MQVCVCILYLHVDLRRVASRTLFEAVTDALTKESEQQVDSTLALTNCENKVTFSERSYAHCSMYSVRENSDVYTSRFQLWRLAPPRAFVNPDCNVVFLFFSQQFVQLGFFLGGRAHGRAAG